MSLNGADPDYLLPEEPRPGRDVLGPGIDDVRELTAPDRISRERVSFAERGDAMVIAHGRRDYVDVFGRPCWTTFRYRFSWPVNDTNLVSCDEGNSADDRSDTTPVKA